MQNLSANDNVAVFSFGDTARLESGIASGTPSALSAIDALNLASTSEQTDIGDGLLASAQTLSSDGTSNHKIIVLLTDGVPDEPTVKGQPDYPKMFAEQMATTLKTEGITLYTIGLGSGVDANFLQTLATDNTHYFFAPDKTTLAGIYSTIGQSLCQKKPSTIQVIYRLPQ